IYGGIWAEMLEDRKFYFPIDKNYDPYQSLEKTNFPVVGASPWQILGDQNGVQMVQKDAFVGDQTPCIAPGSGIRQRDLGVIGRKQYQGSIWLRSEKGNPGSSVTVTLISGEQESDRASHTITPIPGEWQRFEWVLSAQKSSDRAMLEVTVEGDHRVFVGTLSLMPSDHIRGMRADTLALLKQLNAPMYRWPGGNFVSGYDWRDGIGPRDRRPPRKNPAWTGVEHNDVGLNEFLDFCRELNAEPLITVNTGFGDASSAAMEVEYCNGSPETIGGRLRIADGRTEPYRVRYWCVGNEMFGPWQLGFMQLNHYTQKHNRVARAMVNADPSIKLIGVGNLNGFNPRHDPDQKEGWTEVMLRDCGNLMDYISEHFYRGSQFQDKAEMKAAEHVGFLRESIRGKVEGHRKLQKKLGLLPDRMIPIAMDEWNYWHHNYVYGELGCTYNLADALGVAAGLHEYFRSTDVVHMAHYAQTVNVIGCIKTTKTEAFMDSTAFPLLLYRNHFGTQPVEVSGIPADSVLDIVAAVTKDGSALTVAVVNPSPDEAGLDLTIEGTSVERTGKEWLVSGTDPRAVNRVDDRPIQVRETDKSIDGEWTVPGYSFAILRLPIRKS
ncbi:MAG: hypothetical protein JW829_16080, partial [Pirellulales bacterium]|nr:hypothetical protein [Pirellulales bacterium]